MQTKRSGFQTGLRGRTVTFENKSMQRGKGSVFSVHAYTKQYTSLQSNLAVVRLLYLSVFDAVVVRLSYLSV